MIKTGNFIFVLGLLFSCLAQAEVRVTATVDQNKIGQGDALQLDVSVASEESVSVEDPQLPELTGFALLNRSTSEQTQSIFENGKFKVNQTQIFSYVLSPQKTGNLKIDSVRVKVGGKEYSTVPINITVVAGQVSPPNQGQAFGGRGRQQRPQLDDEEDPFNQMESMFNQLLRRRQMPGIRTQPINPEDAFFIQVEVDKNSVFVGEQVTANWYLYTRGHITEIDTLKHPELKGFWKEEIDLSTKLNFVGETVNGIQYSKALLASYALFPIKAGASSIDPYTAKCKVITPNNFGFGRSFEFTKSSQDIKIKVKELPAAGRPSDFSGAVGQFNISAQLDKTTVPANTPFSFKIKIEGRGNAKQIELPELNLPKSVEKYDSKLDAKFFKSGESFKEFEVFLIPRAPGKVDFPATSISFFDPAQSKYYRREIPGFTLNVTPGTGENAIAHSPLDASSPSGEMKAILPGLAREAGVPTVVSLSRLGWSWAFFVIVMVVGFGAWTYRVLYLVDKRSDLLQQLRERIKKIYSLANQDQWRQVGVEGTNVVYQLLGEISGLGGGNMDSNRLLEKSPPSLRREVGPAIQKLLTDFELLGFAPEGIVGDRKEKKHVKSLIAQLEKAMVRAIQLMVVKRDEKKVES